MDRGVGRVRVREKKMEVRANEIGDSLFFCVGNNHSHRFSS